jgi:hypothetical protein
MSHSNCSLRREIWRHDAWRRFVSVTLYGVPRPVFPLFALLYRLCGDKSLFSSSVSKGVYGSYSLFFRRRRDARRICWDAALCGVSRIVLTLFGPRRRRVHHPLTHSRLLPDIHLLSGHTVFFFHEVRVAVPLRSVCQKGLKPLAVLTDTFRTGDWLSNERFFYLELICPPGKHWA